MYKEAFAEAKACFGFYDPSIVEAFDGGYAEGGYPAAMKRAADALAAHSRKAYVNPTDIAFLYIGAGGIQQ